MAHPLRRYCAWSKGSASDQHQLAFKRASPKSTVEATPNETQVMPIRWASR